MFARLPLFLLSLLFMLNCEATALQAHGTPLLLEDTASGGLAFNADLRNGTGRQTYSIVLGETVYQFSDRRRDDGQPGGRLWVGQRPGGDPREEVILTEGNGTLYGRVVTREGSWLIGPTQPGGPVEIRREGRSVIDPHSDDGLRLPRQISQDLPSTSQAASTPTQAGDDIIDVGIIYSQEIRDYYGPALATRMQYLVNLFDQALRESDTGVTARLAFLGEVPIAWDDQVTTPQTLDDLYAGGGFGDPGTSETATGSCMLSEPCLNDGDLSGVFAIRNDRALDVIVFVRRAYRLVQQGCGMAFVNGQNAADIDPAIEHPRAFAVVGDGIDGSGTGTECTELTLAHEIGHLMGSDHNIEAARSIGVFDYSFGYRVDCAFKTILSYDSLGSNVVCPGNNPATAPNEARVVRFSNPDLLDCMDQACGSRTADPVTDNARSIRLEGRDVQFFRHPSATVVRSAVLPQARAVRNNTPATAFMSVVNPASATDAARECGLRLHGAAPGDFSYQTTDPETNAVTGSVDTPVDIPAGAVQTFVFTVRSATARTATGLIVSADCANRRMTEVQPGVNTFSFISTSLQVADIVAVSATAGTPGSLRLPSEDGAAAFAVATTNLGALSTINVVPRTGSGMDQSVIESIEVCRTDPTSGTCMTSRSATGSFLFRADEQLTFAVFVRGQGGIENRPATNRIFLDFVTPSGLLVGSTSVAVQTGSP